MITNGRLFLGNHEFFTFFSLIFFCDWQGLDAAGFSSVYLMAQPLGYHTPDAGKQVEKSQKSLFLALRN